MAALAKSCWQLGWPFWQVWDGRNRAPARQGDIKTVHLIISARPPQRRLDGMGRRRRAALHEADAVRAGDDVAPDGRTAVVGDSGGTMVAIDLRIIRHGGEGADQVAIGKGADGGSRAQKAGSGNVHGATSVVARDGIESGDVVV